MRAGLIDKAGFESYSKEVIMLAKLCHKNIVAFKGYVRLESRKGIDELILKLIRPVLVARPGRS